MRITDAVTYTGVLNPSMRVFDVIMRTEYGTSYNSYLVKGSERTAAVESAHLGFFDYYMDNLTAALDGAPLDYLILNHCEPDHSGCVARLVERYPNLTVVASQAGAIYLRQITNLPALNLLVVKDGDSIDLGGRTLRFLSAPFLHWPDSMFTWLEEDRVLFSCDFLGAHFCEPRVFDHSTVYDDKYWSSLKYYYDCIFGPFRPYVEKGLQKIEGLDIAYACTSHGPVLTREGKLGGVLARYREWCAPPARESLQIPIFYVSAYGNTGRLAAAIARGVEEALPGARVDCFNIIEHDLGELAARMNESDAFLIGSPTINRDAVAPVWQLLGQIEAVGIQKRPVGVFGSYGWSGEAVPHIVERLRSVKAEVIGEPLGVFGGAGPPRFGVWRGAPRYLVARAVTGQLFYLLLMALFLMLLCRSCRDRQLLFCCAKKVTQKGALRPWGPLGPQTPERNSCWARELAGCTANTVARGSERPRSPAG